MKNNNTNVYLNEYVCCLNGEVDAAGNDKKNNNNILNSFLLLITNNQI